MHISFMVFISIFYYFIRRNLRFPVVDPHVGFMSYAFKSYGNNFFKYLTLNSFFSVYLISVSFGKSKQSGILIYNFVLTFSGVCIYFIVLEAFKSEEIAVISLSFFYFLSLLPRTFVEYVEPEAYANFFSVAGLLIVIYGINHEVLTLICIGVVVSSLGLWCKLTTPESLWAILYIYFAKGIGTELIIGSLSFILTVGSYILITAIGSKMDDSIKLRSTILENGWLVKFKEFIKDMAWHTLRSFPEKSISGVIKHLGLQLYEHLCIIFPVVFLFIIGILFGDISLLHRNLIFSWIAVSFLPALVRLQFFPLRYFMAHIPLAIGASYGLIFLMDYFLIYYLISIPICIIMIYVVMKNYKKYNLRPAYYKASLRVKEVVDFLKEKVSPNDYIFQDHSKIQLYYELCCNGPPMQFLWVGGYKFKTALETEESRQAFIQYFIKKRPKYYISFVSYTSNSNIVYKSINLKSIEALSGLKYDLIHVTGEDYVYKLSKVQKVNVEKKIDFEFLFSNLERDARDEIIDLIVYYLKDKVTSEEYIFQNSNYSEIYSKLAVKTISKNFLCADKIDIRSYEIYQSIINCFIMKKPKYYIGLSPSIINLTALEKTTGLRYKIEKILRCSIYKLVASGLPVEELESPVDLFLFDKKRSREDIEAYSRLTQS